MANAQEFFTPEAIASISGAVAAVTVVSVTTRKLTSWNSPIIPFCLSISITYIIAGSSGSLTNIPFYEFPREIFFTPLIGWLLPIVNGCLLFTAVLGATEVAGRIEKTQIENTNKTIKNPREEPPSSPGESRRPRPSQLHPSLMPNFPPPNLNNTEVSDDYIREILRSVGPVGLQENLSNEQLRRLAERIAKNREVAGVHFPSDNANKVNEIAERMAHLIRNANRSEQHGTQIFSPWL